jgi:gliding motility-associated-like protein
MRKYYEPFTGFPAAGYFRLPEKIRSTRVFYSAVFFAAILFSLPVYAQICAGSLGDPIINITFGTGGNPGAALSSATTNYQYVASDCPNDGFYSVRNSSTACFGSTWHTITDHTGDPNGYFMLVNASMTPGAFYLDTVKGLCGNTTYEFAAWVLNMLKPSSCNNAGIRPNLTFKIERTDGTLLQSYSTNDIIASATPQWKQFGFFFKLPSGATDIVVRIINNSQGGCGNDIALDDITFRPCGPQLSAVIDGQSSNTVSLCEGASGTYSFSANISPGFNSPVVQWQERVNGGDWTDIVSATSNTFTRTFAASLQPGSYMFRIVAAESGNIFYTQCRVASYPLTVNVASNPLPNANANSPGCEGSTTTLSVTGNTAAWTGPNGFTSPGTRVTISNTLPTDSGMYYVNVWNDGCSRMDSVRLIVNPRPVIEINRRVIWLCEADTARIQISGATNYSWTPQTGLGIVGNEIKASPGDSTLYTITGENMFACKDTVTLQVNILKRPVADAGPDVFLMEGERTPLSGAVSGDSLTYYWRPDVNIIAAETLTPVVNPASNSIYFLYANSAAGCGMDVDSVNVFVYKKLIIPNSFSPNDDGINDRWNIKGIETYSAARLSIFDRYGKQVYHSSNFKSWDGNANGKPLPVGIYYYLVSYPARIAGISGWLLLIR